MKKFFSIVLCLNLVLIGSINLVYAESNVINNSSEANRLICSDEGIENLLDFNNNMIGSLRKEKDATNINFSIGKFEKDDAEITMDGIFEYNGNQYEVEADGEVETHKSKVLGKLLMGHLKGKIYIGDEEREINVNYEETKDNIYYSITINNLASEEGFAVFGFGESQMDEDILRELGFMRDEFIDDTEDEENTINPMGYDPYDFDWAGLDYYNGLILKGTLYLEDDITTGRSGKMLTTVQVDFDDAEELIEEEDGIEVLLINVDEFTLNYYSYDGESSFAEETDPYDDDSPRDVYDALMSLLESIPGVPDGLINYLDYVFTDIGNDVNVYGNMHDKYITIEPGDDGIMDWNRYRTGGYPVTVYVNKDQTATRDRIKVYFDADLKVYYGSGRQSFYVGTDYGILTEDLSDY